MSGQPEPFTGEAEWLTVDGPWIGGTGRRCWLCWLFGHRQGYHSWSNWFCERCFTVVPPKPEVSRG